MPTFLIDDTMTRPTRAALGVWNAIAAHLPGMTTKERKVAWSRISFPTAIWRLADEAYKTLDNQESRDFLRLLALLWQAEVRDEVVMQPQVRDYVERLALLLEMHSTFNSPLSVRTATLAQRIEWQLDGRVIPGKPQGDETSWAYAIASRIATVSWCRKGATTGANRLAEYIEINGLRPEDLGVTQREIDAWVHAMWVETALLKITCCRDARDELAIFLNIKGVLRSLQNGVSLSEASISRDELMRLHAQLKTWFPKAIARPFDHVGTMFNRQQLQRDQTEIMAMFDAVLARLDR